MKNIRTLTAVVIVVIGGTFSAEAQILRQQGLLGGLGIETPAMRSARQQTSVAMQNREKAEAAKDAVEGMLGAVRGELKLSIDEIKKEAVDSARMLDEANALREKALAMKAEAEEIMAEALAAKAKADQAIVEARQAAETAAELKKAVALMQADTAKQIENYHAGVEQLKKEREEFEQAKREHEEQKNKDQKEQQERLGTLNAKQEDRPKPVIEDESSENEGYTEAI